MALTNDQKKDLAKTLYLKGDLNQKEIAAHVAVTEKTMGKWVAEGKWDTMRKSLTTTKAEQLAFLYEILAKMTQAGKAALDDDDPATNPDYDGISKISKAIERLEKETNVGEMIQTGMLFLDFVKTEDLEVARLFNKWFKAFIEDQIAKAK